MSQLVGTSFPSNIIQLNTDFLHFGDIISLSVDAHDEKTGFLSVNGIVDYRCGVTITKEGEYPQKFRESLFRVQYPNQYLAQKDLQKFKDSEEFMIESPEQTQKLNYLIEKVKAEKEENQMEMERRNGTTVHYGQFIQLFHLVSKKFLTIFKDTAELQKDSLMVSLDEEGSTASYFQIQSFYKFRNDGENVTFIFLIYKVTIDDKVRFYNKKYVAYLNISHLKFDDERFEVNSNHLKTTRWTMIEYYSSSKNDINTLKSGDTVRLFHKEYEGYLIVNDTGPKNVVQLISQNDLSKFTSNTLWQIEYQDLTKGGQIEWTNSYKFLNVATGEYLCADLKDSADSLDYEDDDYIPMTPKTLQTPLPRTNSKTIQNLSKVDLTKIDSPKIITPKLEKPLEKEGENEKKEEGAKKSSPSFLSQFKDITKVDSPDPSPEVQIQQKPKTRGKNFAQNISSLSTLRSFVNEKPFIPKTSFLLQTPIDSTLESSLPEKQYLTIGSIFTKKEATSDHWCFYSPSNDASGPIVFGSYGKIRHFESETWMHPSVTLTNEKNKKEKEKSRNRPFEVCTSLKSIIEDTFQIQKVSEVEIDNLFVIQSLQIPLLLFIEKISNEEKRKKIIPKDILPTQQALVKLLKFITKSPMDEKQILHRSATFDGIPLPECQNILRERKFLDSCLNILQLCFDYQIVNQKSVNLLENRPYQKTFQLAYCALRLASKNNPENGVYMAKYVELMQKQIAYDIGASDALFYILKDNYDLLTNIDTNSIDFFIDTLKNNEKDSKMLLFLSILCNVNDTPVSQNQDYIIEKLVDHRVIQKILILPYLDSQGNVFVHINGKKIDLVTFTTSSQYSKLVDYFKETIELLSRVCIGRNSISIAIVNEMIIPKIISKCIINENLPKSIRNHFVNVMIHTNVTGEPFEKRPLCPLTRIWKRIDKPRKRDNYEKSKEKEFHEVKDFMFIYFKNASLRMLDVLKNGENQFTLHLLSLLRRMIEYGIYILDELLPLLPFLHSLLDDINYTYNLDVQKRKETKYQNNEINQLPNDIKIEILSIFERVMDLDTSNLIEKILLKYKKQENEEDQMNFYNFNTIQFFREYSAFNNIRTQDFELCLIDTLKFENIELSSKALNVLFRFRTRKEELVEKLSRVELLVSDLIVNESNILSNVYIKLKNIMTGIFSSSEFNEGYQYITYMLDEIKKPEKMFFAQTVLRNLDFQRFSISMLKKKYQIKEHKAKMVACIYQMIKYFVKDNPKNQALMFPHLEFLISKLGPMNHIWECIVEIVRNNIALCSTIDEKNIQNYIQFMAESNPSFQAAHIEFLSSIVVVNNVPIKRNQNMVIKSLIERKNDVMILFNDEESLKERNDLILSNDIKNENGKLNYYFKLIELLTLCCKGKVHTTEVQIQSIFTIDEVIIQLKDEQTPPDLKILLFKFLNEVFIYTEKKNLFVTSNQPLWETIDHFVKDINHKVINNDYESLDIEFIFNIFPSFLYYYFTIHYEYKEHAEGTVKLLKQVYEILKSTTINSEYRNRITNLIQLFDYLLKEENEYPPLDFQNLKSNNKVTELPRKETEIQKAIEDSKVSTFSDFITFIIPLIKNESDLGFSEYYLANPFFNFYDDFVVPIVSLIDYLILKKDKYIETILLSLRSLQHLINRSNEENQEEIQNTLAKCGVTNLCLNLIKSQNNEIVGEAFKLAISLADGGNKLVQQQIYDHFINETDASIFLSIRERIRKAISEIKDKKTFIKREREKEVAYYQTILSIGNLRPEKLNFVLENYSESGHIKDILRFLQLTCEGHNILNQQYLSNQKKSTKSINLVLECLSYIVHLKKYIDYSNITIAMQCFDSLNEFIQGPCVENQILLNQTQIYQLANDLLNHEVSIEIEKDYNDNISMDEKYIRNIITGINQQIVEKNIMRYEDLIELKMKVVALLISQVSESRVESIAEMMKNTLNLEIIFEQINRLLSKSHKEKVKKQFESEIRCYILYDYEEYISIKFEEKLNEIYEKEEELCYQYYILLNYLSTFEESSQGYIRKRLKKLNEKEFKTLEVGTGRIEVIRNDKLEKIYFRIPEFTKSLSKETKTTFIKSCPRETPQQKVKELFGKTPYFKREMEYFSEKNQSFLFRSTYKLKQPLLIIQLIISLICNLIGFFTMSVVINVESPNSVVPIPGITSGTSSLPKEAIFSDPYSYIIFLVFAIIQLCVLTTRLIFHFIFEIPLRVRSQYPTKGAHEKWNDIQAKESTNIFLKTIQYTFLDIELWSIVIFIAFTFIGIFATPAIVSFQTLFEIILLSTTIKKYIIALFRSGQSLILTYAFLIIVINTFLTVCFFAFPEWYFIISFEGANISRGRQYICDTMLHCFYLQVGYSFRAISSYEAIIPSFRYSGNYLALFNWVFMVLLNTSINFILVQIFLGIIIQVFVTIRIQRYEILENIEKKCFICDVEKARFDIVSHKGIDFEYHRHKEHELWDYVAYLIYLTDKSSTDYSGMEQYLANLIIKKDSVADLSFFPCLRAMVLEDEK